MTEKKLSRDDAYMLISIASDLNITQVVDHNKGVHVNMPKAIFKKHDKTNKRFSRYSASMD
jgi:acetamidase/formamidase